MKFPAFCFMLLVSVMLLPTTALGQKLLMSLSSFERKKISF